MANYQNRQKKRQQALARQKQPAVPQKSDIDAKQWIFEPVDSWFFREMRPFQVTGAELGSLFPPPARTLAGAVRGIIGERAGVNWAEYRKGKGEIVGLDLCEEMGNPTSAGETEFGKLELTGPYLLKDGKRLYPVPQHLLQEEKGEQDEQEKYYWLHPGAPLHCDLGCVQLPVIKPTPSPDKKLKPLLNVWVDADNLRKILHGEKPDKEKLYRATDLFARETRIGIGLDKERKRRTTEEGLLYQTSHIRLCDKVALGMGVSGIDARLQLNKGETRHIRLGGEGRMAAVSPSNAANLPQTPVNKDTKQIVLVLLTPLLVPEDRKFFMPFKGAKKVEHQGADAWEVTLQGIKLKIISAALGKPQREGGWNLAQHKPRALRSLVPAGSVWFCEVLDSGDPSVLHGAKIGEETALGRGELAVGVWPGGR